MINQFLYDLLAAMIKQHGANKVKARLTQLHAEMSVASTPKKQEEKICPHCGGDGGIHYCK